MLEFFRRKRHRATPATESWMGRCIGTATPTELEHAQRLLTDCHVTAPFVEPGDDEYELWRAGKLVPFYLTELLNAGGHFGPEVDTACLAEEPAVDRWEVGVEYPSWEQTVALARFLDVRARSGPPRCRAPAPRGPSTTQDLGSGDPVLRACGRLSGHSRCRRHRARHTRRSPRRLKPGSGRPARINTR